MKTGWLMVFACIVCALVASAAPRTADGDKARTLSPQERALARLRRTGGKIVKPGSQRGTIALVDTQCRFAHSNVVAVAKSLNKLTKFNVVAAVSKLGAPKDVLRAAQATLAIVVVDDADTPALLIAPEDRWACVNVNKLDAGLLSDTARRKFFESRGRRELYRAFSLLCGGGSSQFDNNLTVCASQPEIDLCDEMLPIDVVARCMKYLPKLGVTQRLETTYSRACREGWAPPPTNDCQKAVWTRIRENKERGPSKPITIPPPGK